MPEIAHTCRPQRPLFRSLFHSLFPPFPTRRLPSMLPAVLTVVPLLVASLLTPLARADDTEPVRLPTVATELKRDASAFPYRQMNTVLNKLARYGEGLVRLDFRIDAEKAGLPAEQIRVVIRSDEADYAVRMREDGVFTLPALPEAEGATADFATNVAKGKLNVRGTLELNLTAEQLTMAKVRQLMRVARTLREQMLPWYARLLFPRIEAVRICSAAPGWELEWREDGQLLGLPLPVTPGEREPDAKKDTPRACTLLTGDERWPDAARLVAPAGTKVSVKY